MGIQRSVSLTPGSESGEANGVSSKNVLKIMHSSFNRGLLMHKTESMSKIDVNQKARLKTFMRTDSLPAKVNTRCFSLSRESSEVLSVKMLKKELKVRTGNMVILFSTITSDDLDLEVIWYIGEKEAVNGGRYRHWRKGFDCCLEIFDCDVTDAGEITCIAHTSSCTASDTTILIVDDDDMAGDEPQFFKNLEFAETNGCLELTCSVSGYPVPYVTFHSRNRRISTDERIHIDRKGECWKLRIYDCTVDDEGKYAAIARNRIGRSLSYCHVVLDNKNPSTYIADV